MSFPNNESYVSPLRSTSYLSKHDNELPVILHPLIIGRDVVLCMPEVNKVLRNVYQVLSQANYYLSKHRISSRRYTGAQLIRIKMLGILGHEAKVCSYILQKHAEKIFNSFDMTGDCKKSEAMKWMEPVLLDQKNIDDSPNVKSADPVDNTPGIPATINVFKLGKELIVCTPDIQKVLQIKFNTGSTTGYYYAKLGIAPYKFEKLEHLHKVKELGIIKSSAIHCTYVLKEDALKVFGTCGMNSMYTEDNLKFLDVIDLGDNPQVNWKQADVEIKQEENPSPASRPCFSPASDRSGGRRSIGSLSDEDDELRRHLKSDDMTVHVFIVDNKEVVCMPDIHKIVQSIHGNSIQVNYYFNKLKVQKRRFCFAHLRELKARNILQNNATYCTYVPREDAEKLFQIHFLVDDPKLNDINWMAPVNLDNKLSDMNDDSNDTDAVPVEQLVTVHTFSVDGTEVVTTPDVHRVVDFLDEQSASLDYHFRKLGISKYRFTYSQLHQLRRLNVIKRPTVCTFVSRTDVNRLLKMYETERNKMKIRSIKFLPPVVLVPGSAPAKFKVDKNNPTAGLPPNSMAAPNKSKSFDSSQSRSSLSSPYYKDKQASEQVEKERTVNDIFKHNRNESSNNMVHPVNHDTILSPNTHAMQQLQVMHPSIDCPIVIPNGDYDPLKEYNNANGKRPYDDDLAMNKKFKGIFSSSVLFEWRHTLSLTCNLKIKLLIVKKR